MFNLSGSEIIVILLLALVVLGPEKLPEALRRAGRTYAELKKMGNSFQAEMKSVLDEPMKEMRETADLLKKSVDFTDGEATGRRIPSRLASAPGRQETSTSAAADNGATVHPAPLSADTAAGETIAESSAAAPPDAAVSAPTAPRAASSPHDTPTQRLSPEDELINRTLSGEPGAQ